MIHGAKYEQLRPGLDVLFLQRVKIQVKADHAGHGSEIHPDYWRSFAERDALLAVFLPYQMVLVVPAADGSIAADKTRPVAQADFVVRMLGRIGDVYAFAARKGLHVLQHAQSAAAVILGLSP